jgi:hypothetical protein
VGNISLVNGWLKEFGNEAGVELKLDENGAALFNYKDNVTIGVETTDNADWVSFFSPLYDTSSTSTYKLHFLLIYLLEKNLPEGGLHGSAFAYDYDSNTVMLCYNCSTKVFDCQNFISALKAFIKLASLKVDEIEKHIKELPEFDASNENKKIDNKTPRVKKEGSSTSVIPTIKHLA